MSPRAALSQKRSEQADRSAPVPTEGVTNKAQVMAISRQSAREKPEPPNRYAAAFSSGTCLAAGKTPASDAASSLRKEEPGSGGANT